VLTYNLIGQVEHAGALSGGHYWARGLRSGGQAYLLNDTGVSPAAFAHTAQTYIVAYHYVGARALAA
jgi:ubiquitin C-terminal hydrolase